MEFTLFDIPIDIFLLSKNPSLSHHIAEALSQAIWMGVFASFFIELILSLSMREIKAWLINKNVCLHYHLKKMFGKQMALQIYNAIDHLLFH